MAATTASSTSLEEHLFNHLCLPPRLPSRQETRPLEIQNALLERVLKVCKDFTSQSLEGDWDSLRRHLQICKTLNFDGNLNKTSLLKAFRELQANDLLIVHVTAQNAGLLIRRCQM
jgi:hypothetical protein